MAGTIEITLTPRSDSYAEDDDRWQGQIADLVHELRVETEAFRIERTEVPGTKGTITELVLALGEAGVFTTAVEVMRVWLARDKTRSIELDYNDASGHRQQLTVAATNADEAALAPVVAAVAARISSAT